MSAELAKQRVEICEQLMKLPYIKATRNTSVGPERFVCRDDVITLLNVLRLRAAQPADGALREQLLAFQKTLLALEPYINHSPSCSHDDRSFSGGYCTCEYRWAQSIHKQEKERVEWALAAQTPKEPTNV